MVYMKLNSTTTSHTRLTHTDVNPSLQDPNNEKIHHWQKYLERPIMSSSQNKV